MTPEIKTRITQLRHGIVPEGYHKTPSGTIPDDWVEYLLGDIYAERKEAGNPELPVLSVSIHSGVSEGELDENQLGKKVKRIEDKTQYRTAHSGDLVFNMMRAWQGAIGVVKNDGLASPAYIVAKPNDKVFPAFMDYYMKTPRMVGIINRQSYGVTDFRKRLYWDSFKPINCAFPKSVEEQRKIAVILSAQNKVIELKEKRIEEKQQQKKYLMQQLLTGKNRLKGFTQKWKTYKLGEVATMGSGGTPSSENDKYFGDKYVWVSISDISTAGKYISNSEKHLSQSGFDNCSAKLFPIGTLLFAMYASIGKCVITKVELCSSQAILGIQTSSELTVEYLYYFLSERKEKLKNLGQASSQPNLNKKIVQSIGICLPCKEEQKAIVRILSTADHELDLLQQDLEQEQKKKKALMQLLLTGIARVKT